MTASSNSFHPNDCVASRVGVAVGQWPASSITFDARNRDVIFLGLLHRRPGALF
jgi:hypothetical protein